MMLTNIIFRQLNKPINNNKRYLSSIKLNSLKNYNKSRYSYIDRRFAGHDHGHGHHHEEPPHYAYRGDGLPSVKCEELQQMLHMNECLRTKKSEKGEKEPHPSEVPLTNVDPNTKQVFYDLQTLYNKVLTSNWHDTVQLTMNMDIWNGNLERLRKKARDLPHLKVQDLLAETLKLFDVVYQVEDLQDHLYELMEELAVNAAEGESADSYKVPTNLNEHVSEVLKRYHELKRTYPEFTQKFKESLGYTLAVLRQRYTFEWPEEHSYFY